MSIQVDVHNTQNNTHSECNASAPVSAPGIYAKVKARGSYPAGDVRLEALIKQVEANKQNLGFIALDEYLDSTGMGGTIPDSKLNLLTGYVINKVQLKNNIYYLSSSKPEALSYICSDSDEWNQIDINLNNKYFYVSSSETKAKDHSKLNNLDYSTSGHTGFAGIEFGTTAYWNSQTSYVPVKGMLVIYTDYSVDESGNNIPNFKIGDGNAYLIDKPFIGEDTREALIEHINDSAAHVTAQERVFWNNKLNYNDPEGDLLEFTRD